MKPIIPMPRLAVALDGAPLPPDVLSTLGELSVSQMLSAPGQCELTFFEPPAEFADGTRLSPGAALEVRLGDGEPLFTGELTAVEFIHGPSQGRMIRARGYDLLHRLRKAQPVRAHVQLTCADLARELAGPLGLEVQATDEGPPWQRLIQFRQSDLDLLVETTERCGLYFTLRGQVLQMITLAGIGDALPLKLGDTLLETRIEINGDSACRSVRASAWDPAKVETRQGQADRARVGREIAARVWPDRLGSNGQRTLVDEAVHDDQQAEAIAQAELDRHVVKEVSLWGVADGNTALRPGTIIDVTGVGASFEGRYVIASARHAIDTHKGYTTEVSTAPPAPRPRRRGTIAAWGRVSRVDDPDRLGRVQVSLPTYGDVETDWMGVVIAGAGKGKGMISLPDVNDHVLVLFTNEDPAQGLVVGGLYGAGGAPDEGGVEGNAVRRYLMLTPGGQKLELDDTRKSARLQNSDGSFIEMTPDKVVLHANRDLHLEAPGKSVYIRGDQVHFDRK